VSEARIQELIRSVWPVDLETAAASARAKRFSLHVDTSGGLQLRGGFPTLERAQAARTWAFMGRKYVIHDNYLGTCPELLAIFAEYLSLTDNKPEEQMEDVEGAATPTAKTMADLQSIRAFKLVLQYRRTPEAPPKTAIHRTIFRDEMVACAVRAQLTARDFGGVCVEAVNIEDLNDGRCLHTDTGRSGDGHPRCYYLNDMSARQLAHLTAWEKLTEGERAAVKMGQLAVDLPDGWYVNDEDATPRRTHSCVENVLPFPVNYQALGGDATCEAAPESHTDATHAEFDMVDGPLVESRVPVPALTWYGAFDRYASEGWCEATKLDLLLGYLDDAGVPPSQWANATPLGFSQELAAHHT
jgi:hypothetical protein